MKVLVQKNYGPKQYFIIVVCQSDKNKSLYKGQKIECYLLQSVKLILITESAHKLDGDDCCSTNRQKCLKIAKSYLAKSNLISVQKVKKF